MKTVVTLQESEGEIVMPISEELRAATGFRIGEPLDLRVENGRLIVLPVTTPPTSKERPAIQG
ncbi:hypothetical protein J2T09_002600 [Neorhizobium huautlense]|uniref:AbrB/MazE/SpoVT family DNA-binding domain-containing protein n=1 Tax=Neorhizobium huautlense TaxID=67774 RepID=A0ABT9PUP2_9HYPH|nr:hypothetical protein [Neorhizobium huautlense]MDP9837843.1 hypothetical protein [Neorhizobium huautlense]